MTDSNSKNGFGLFASWRVIVGIIAGVACLWVAVIVVNFFTGSSEKPSRYHEVVEENPIYKKTDGLFSKWFGKKDEHAEKTVTTHPVEKKVEQQHVTTVEHKPEPLRIINDIDPEIDSDEIKSGLHNEKQNTHMSSVHDTNSALGTSFTTALIKPIEYELNERSLGWRPNDIILSLFTENVEMTQRGVLDVVRRTSENLVERIAKTGSAIQFDKNLDKARSKFNYGPESFMFPSAEDAYKEGIEELKKYRERLNRNSATFYARADRLIPLLKSYEELLGSCDNDLVKGFESNGDKVSFFRADDYFYYAQGVAMAMSSVLHAVLVDFSAVLEPRGATSDLNYVIKELHHAQELSPIIILESDLDGVFANHRANMAAYIGHAKAYIQFIIKTMST